MTLEVKDRKHVNTLLKKKISTITDTKEISTFTTEGLKFYKKAIKKIYVIITTYQQMMGKIS